MADTVAPFVTLDNLQPKARSFVTTGNEHLSLLTVYNVVESRTPSPRLANGIKRQASSLVI
jgi:hypothetical protein